MVAAGLTLYSHMNNIISLYSVYEHLTQTSGSVENTPYYKTHSACEFTAVQMWVVFTEKMSY